MVTVTSEGGIIRVAPGTQHRAVHIALTGSIYRETGGSLLRTRTEPGVVILETTLPSGTYEISPGVVKLAEEPAKPEPVAEPFTPATPGHIAPEPQTIPELLEQHGLIQETPITKIIEERGIPYHIPEPVMPTFAPILKEPIRETAVIEIPKPDVSAFPIISREEIIKEEGFAPTLTEEQKITQRVEQFFTQASPVEKIVLRAHTLFSAKGFEYLTAGAIPGGKTADDIVREQLALALKSESEMVSAPEYIGGTAAGFFMEGPGVVATGFVGGYGFTRLAATRLGARVLGAGAVTVPTVVPIVGGRAISPALAAIYGTSAYGLGTEIASIYQTFQEDPEKAWAKTLGLGGVILGGIAGYRVAKKDIYRAGLRAELAKLSPKKQAEFKKFMAEMDKIDARGIPVKDVTLSGMDRIPIKARKATLEWLRKHRSDVLGGSTAQRTQTYGYRRSYATSDIDLYTKVNVNTRANAYANMLRNLGIERVSVVPGSGKVTIGGVKVLEYHPWSMLVGNIEAVGGSLEWVRSSFTRDPTGIRLLRLTTQAKRKLVGGFLQRTYDKKDITDFLNIRQSLISLTQPFTVGRKLKGGVGFGDVAPDEALIKLGVGRAPKAPLYPTYAAYTPYIPVTPVVAASLYPKYPKAVSSLYGIPEYPKPYKPTGVIPSYKPFTIPQYAPPARVPLSPLVPTYNLLKGPVLPPAYRPPTAPPYKPPKAPTYAPYKLLPKPPKPPKIPPYKPPKIPIGVPPLKPRKDPLLVWSNLMIKRKKILKEPLYTVQFKKRGKWTRVGDRLPYTAALSRGGTIVDETPSARFRVRRAAGRARKPSGIESEMWKMIRPKFRPYRVRKGVKYPLKQEWIERTAHRIDSLGELSGITMKGLAAPRRPKRRKKRRRGKTEFERLIRI